MKCPVIPAKEQERLKALSAHGLDREGLIRNLDPVVRIAARMFGMPIAAVNMIGSDHVFFAAAVGAGEMDMRRDVSFCAHAINQGQVMVVPDATLDERFHDNPLVTGEANLRFYAGIRLLSPEGLALGALCICDHQPHFDFSTEDQLRLQELAHMVSDRLELRRIETCSNQTRPNFEEYAGQSQTPVVWFDESLHIVTWNQAAADSHGYCLAEGGGRSVQELFPESQRQAFRDMVAIAVEEGSVDHLAAPSDMHGLRKDGTEFLMGLSLFGWKESGAMHFEAILKDISGPGQPGGEAQSRASLDLLTGLPNRVQFYRAVDELLMMLQPAAVIMLDLDSFKDINDTLGHAVGDAVLTEIAGRLSALAAVPSFAARIGGDEFALLLPRIDQPEQALHWADQVINHIERPIQVLGQSVRVAASAGVALSPLHAHEALELVSDADLALFKAKSLGRGHSFLFTPALRLEAVSRRLYALELHRAVDEGEFVLYYQPQVNLASREVTGAEALIRWNHPQRGLLAPIAFLAALESGTLAATVGAWVLDEACAQLAYWRRQGASGLRMGVNLFSVQFHMGNLVEVVMETLARHGLPPEALELEITENIALNSDEEVLHTLQALKAYGVGIAFDDFGTGYASLSLLKSYPLTRIKIDRIFVHGMLQHKQDDSVVCATLDIAHGFDLQSIAEGIETEAQYAYLKAKHCEEGQGYLFGKPMPATQFSQLIGLNVQPRTKCA